MIAFLNWLDGVLWGVPLIALMILTGLYFTVRSGFFQFRHFGWIMKRTGGKLFQKEDKASEGKGMLSSFEAISTAIGGTVGFGNIAGVATAVAAGGPGAIMWMWLSSLLGMILTINEQISNFAQTYPTNLKASSNEALLFMRRYRFANCSCFSCCFKDAYPSSNVQ